jgi:hypothetical protein
VTLLRKRRSDGVRIHTAYGIVQRKPYDLRITVKRG